ncbi:Fibroblast growth factor receptor-like 1 [Amphibalanus amphitrite]|uniref:Fibroblast growth factor receptor-like 1 n=1 Tax=Amphibalanus amphitrite TaxID=1232801 RepID=A0A6A4WPL4_AMPAM|nr:Fibroblast growth factor receptor-like 1 [Amphibalanus amphitrite]
MVKVAPAGDISARPPLLLPLLTLLLLLLLLPTRTAAAKGPPVRVQPVSAHLVARLGGAARLTCPVAGSPPPLLEWRKDGAQVLPGWRRFSRQGNTLHVARLTADDAGVYVCVAVNGFGTERVTTELFVIDPETSGAPALSGGGEGPADNLLTSVHGPPVIRASPDHPDRRVRAPLGSRLQLGCAADGHPPPQLKWYKAGRPVLPSTRLYVQEDGQLVFSQLVRSDEAVFICVASNIFGSANHSFSLRVSGEWTADSRLLTDNHSFSLRVSEPVSADPLFLEVPANSTVAEGDTAVLRCRVQSVSKAHLKWVRRLSAGAAPTFNHTQTVTIKGRRYAVLSGASSSQQGDRFSSELRLPAVSADQQGVYVCLAANGHGYLGREALLQVTSAPPSSAPALLLALPAVAVVALVLAAACCLHRRRQAGPPPPPPAADRKRSRRPAAAGALPSGGRTDHVSPRLPEDGQRAVRAALLPPAARPGADGASVSHKHEPAPTLDYRQLRHLDVV